MKLFSLLFLFVTSCATVNGLNPNGAKVNLITGDPPKKCKDLGSVKSKLGVLGDNPAEEAKNSLRNRAAAMGANYVRQEQSITSPEGSIVEIHGTAFSCP